MDARSRRSLPRGGRADGRRTGRGEAGRVRSRRLPSLGRANARRTPRPSRASPGPFVRPSAPVDGGHRPGGSAHVDRATRSLPQFGRAQRRRAACAPPRSPGLWRVPVLEGAAGGPSSGRARAAAGPGVTARTPSAPERRGRPWRARTRPGPGAGHAPGHETNGDRSFQWDSCAGAPQAASAASMGGGEGSAGQGRRGRGREIRSGAAPGRARDRGGARPPAP